MGGARCYTSQTKNRIGTKLWLVDSALNSGTLHCHNIMTNNEGSEAVPFDSVPWPIESWGGGTSGTIQQRSSFSLFCWRSLWAVLAWAGISTLWCCPSRISSADHDVANPPRCPERMVLERLSWCVTCQNHASFSKAFSYQKVDMGALMWTLCMPCAQRWDRHWWVCTGVDWDELKSSPSSCASNLHQIYSPCCVLANQLWTLHDN